MQTLEVPSRNLMKAKMASGELAVGMIVRPMRGVEITAIARSAGFTRLQGNRVKPMNVHSQDTVALWIMFASGSVLLSKNRST